MAKKDLNQFAKSIVDRATGDKEENKKDVINKSVKSKSTNKKGR
jgi:hypothetical protein